MRWQSLGESHRGNVKLWLFEKMDGKWSKFVMAGLVPAIHVFTS
jgi:hypothetical protein